MSEAFDYDGIKAVFVQASGLPSTNVKWSRDGMPHVGQIQMGGLVGLLVLKVTTDVALGKDDFPTTYASGDQSIHTTQVTRHVVTITGRITEFGIRKALNTLGTIRRKFSGIKVPAMLSALNMSINDTAELVYSDESIDDKAHSSCVFELKLNWCTTVDITDELGNASGTDAWIQTCAPAGTFTH